MINENIPLNINFFQSANNAGKHIADDFVIRTKEYETIINEIRNYPMHDSVQHYLLLGRRGSGKSTLLKRIEYEINNDVALSKKLIPVNLAEEQANIYRLMDLWEEIIKELKHLGLDIDDSLLNGFTGDSNAYNRELYTIIHDALKIADKKIVLLLDNIDRIFENVKEDAALIREVLLNYDDIRIIGGSTRMSEHFWKYDLPFYNFFRVIVLEALSNTEVKTLLLHWAKAYNLPAIENFVKTKPGQLETIRILTDGLPRTLKFFINTIINRSQKDSYNYLKQIMDYVTPLYQERLNNLPAAHRKIVLNLAFIWEAASVKQLAEVCKIESKLLSAYLKQLYQNGIVDKVETNKKNHLYRIAERFFNLWLIFTQGSPSDKRKQKCLTIFLENWYDGKEIKQMALQHLKLLSEKTINADDVALFSKTLVHSKYITTKERDEIIDRTLQLDNITQSLKESLPPKVKQIVEQIKKCVDEKNWKMAKDLTEDIDQDDGTKENILGNIFTTQKIMDKAEKYFVESIQKGNTLALSNLGHLYEIQKRFELAEKYYLTAIEKGVTGTLFNLAVLYRDEKKNELAEKYYLLAIENGDNKALNNLAVLYSKQNRNDLAEKYYLLAIEAGRIKAFQNLALLYTNQGKFELAEKYYLLAIENGVTGSLNNLAVFYKNQGKFELAEKYYLLAIANGNDESLYNLAYLYSSQNKLELAEKYYLMSFEKGDNDALNSLAEVYENQEKFDLAEKYYLLAIEKGVKDALINLAIHYYYSAKNKEKALELLFLYKDKNMSEILGGIEIPIKVWNGLFKNIRTEIADYLDGDNENKWEVLQELLIHKQSQIVSSLFEDKLRGEKLKQEFSALFYASQLLYGRTLDENLLLKIPPEIKETVEELITYILERQKFYYPE